MKPILSVRDLARRLRTTVERLRELDREIKEGKHYTIAIQNDEKTAKVRHFRVPKPELKQLQKRIKIAILDPLGVSECAHGGVRGRSPLTNARQHVAMPCVVAMDVMSFYPNVRHYVVYRFFRHELGFGNEVASLLTRLTTVDAQLPQGAPTSTGVANLLLVRVDVPVTERAREIGAANTRFVDDLAFSGPNKVASLINHAARALSTRRLPVWRQTSKFQERPKLRIMPRSRRQHVTGLNVNASSGPSVPREYRESVRAAIYQWAKLPAGPEREKAEASIRGRILYVNETNPGAARNLQRYLESLRT